MKIAIVGGAGNIGHHLPAHLSARHAITSVDLPMPLPDKGALILGHDLDAARKVWLEQAGSSDEREKKPGHPKLFCCALCLKDAVRYGVVIECAVRLSHWRLPMGQKEEPGLLQAPPPYGHGPRRRLVLRASKGIIVHHG